MDFHVIRELIGLPHFIIFLMTFFSLGTMVRTNQAASKGLAAP